MQVKSNSPVATSMFGVYTAGIRNLRDTASRTEGEQQLSVKLHYQSDSYLNL